MAGIASFCNQGPLLVPCLLMESKIAISCPSDNKLWHPDNIY